MAERFRCPITVHQPSRVESRTMGAWGTGPFDNDTAADFAGDLDDVAEAQRPEVIRHALAKAAKETGYLTGAVAEVAVAAAALVAAQCPAGEPVDPHYGPKQAVPPLPADLQALATRALDRVLADGSEITELWHDADTRRLWSDQIEKLRHTISPADHAHL
ncbi:DUF4259 domain-containing protein [Amycolatopsis japonica]